MTNIEKFQETVSILVHAYLDDTLAHNDCAACAVGNIIAHRLGCVVKGAGTWQGGRWERNLNEVLPIWDEVFITRYNEYQEITKKNYKGYHKRQIDSSGYSLNELARIEHAFETCPKPDIAEEDLSSTNNDWMFNGLMAVVDVLAGIHSVDLSVKENARNLFVKV